MDWILVTAMLLLLVAFIMWLAFTTWQRRVHARLVSEFTTRLFDRLGSAKDLSEFIQSGAGAQFLRSLGTNGPLVTAEDRVIRTIQLGTVLLPLGAGLFGVAGFVVHTANLQQFFTALGLVIVSLGVGFVVSGLVAHRLATTLGTWRRGEPQ